MTISGSFFITRQTAEAAVQFCMPMITEAMKKREVGESGFLYIVVMDPTMSPARCSFEEAILYEHAIGDKSKWDADYGAFARAKARVSWKNGMDSHAVCALKPHMLEAGDVMVWGSVVLDNIVVSVSGANPWYDEAFAGSIAMCLRALAKGAMQVESSRQPFLPTSSA